MAFPKLCRSLSNAIWQEAGYEKLLQFKRRGSYQQTSTALKIRHFILCCRHRTHRNPHLNLLSSCPCTPTFHQVPGALLAFRTRSEKPDSVIEVAFVSLWDSLLGSRHLIQPLHVPKGSGVRLQPGGLTFPDLVFPVRQHLEEGRQEGIATSRAFGQPQQWVELAAGVLRGHACPGVRGALDAERKPVKAAVEANTSRPGTRHAL